jgi:hypothetical protein
MTTVLPPLTDQPPHVTARIFTAQSYETAVQGVAPPGYVGRHRKADPVADERPSRLGVGALLGFFVAASMVAAVFGIQLFSTAW